jgi:hypothetical protein
MTTQISDSPAHTTYNLFQQLFHLSQKTSGAQSQQFTKLTVGCAQISSSKWAELGLPHCPEAELSQERGWGCLGCWGCEAKTEHLWSCVVPCGGTYSATSPLSLCGSIPVLWDGTRNLPLREGSCSWVSYTCFCLIRLQYGLPNPNSHCMMKKQPTCSEVDAILILYCCLYRNVHPSHSWSWE